MRALRRSDRGIATVELALILPILLLLVVGVLDLGIAVSTYATVTNASREGASYAVLHPTAGPSAIASAVVARSAPLASPSVEITYCDVAPLTSCTPADFDPWPAGGMTGSTATDAAVRVEVSYSWSAFTIFVGQFFSNTTLRGASTMEAHW